MLRRTATTPIIILLLSTFAFGWQLPADWVSYSSPDGRFSIGMPKTPVEDVKDVESVVGTLKLHSFPSTSATAHFLVSYGDYPTEPAADNREAILDGVRGGVIKGSEGQLISETKITLDGYPGRQFTAKRMLDGSEIIFNWRIYLVGRRLYQLAAVVNKNNSNSPEIQKFLNSFRLTN